MSFVYFSARIYFLLIGKLFIQWGFDFFFPSYVVNVFSSLIYLRKAFIFKWLEILKKL